VAEGGRGYGEGRKGRGGGGEGREKGVKAGSIVRKCDISGRCSGGGEDLKRASRKADGELWGGERECWVYRR